MIAGRRRVRALMNRPSARRAWRRSVSKSVAPSAAASAIDARTASLASSMQVGGLLFVDPTARDDLGAGDDLAGVGVDGHEHHDHALLGEVAAVAQHARGEMSSMMPSTY